MIRPEDTCGPYLTPEELSNVTGKSLFEIWEHIETGKMIAGLRQDGTTVCPTWQFCDGVVAPVLLRAWNSIRANSDNWTAILWLLLPNPDLWNSRPIDLYQQMRDIRDLHNRPNL